MSICSYGQFSVCHVAVLALAFHLAQEDQRTRGGVAKEADVVAVETGDLAFKRDFGVKLQVHAKRRGEDAEVRLHRLDGVANAVLRRLPREDVVPDDAPPTGISYLDLVAKGFYGEGR